MLHTALGLLGQVQPILSGNTGNLVPAHIPAALERAARFGESLRSPGTPGLMERAADAVAPVRQRQVAKAGTNPLASYMKRPCCATNECHSCPFFRESGAC